MNSNHYLPHPAQRGGKQRLLRVLQEPMTFIVLVWALMFALVGLCFAVVD